MFPTLESFTAHVVAVGGAEEKYRAFCESGYLARQERIGISVLPKFGEFHAPLYNALAGSDDDAPGQVPVVLLSGPTVEEAEFDSLVSTMRDWSRGLGATARRAFGEKLRRSRGIDDGIPATALHAGLPAHLLITYLRRSCDYVAVIETGSRGRRVMATRDIG